MLLGELRTTLKSKTTAGKKGSDNDNELNSPDCSQNGSKDKELFSFFIKAALTFSSLLDLFLPVLGFLAAFSVLS